MEALEEDEAEDDENESDKNQDSEIISKIAVVQENQDNLIPLIQLIKKENTFPTISTYPSRLIKPLNYAKSSLKKVQNCNKNKSQKSLDNFIIKK